MFIVFGGTAAGHIVHDEMFFYCRLIFRPVVMFVIVEVGLVSLFKVCDHCRRCIIMKIEKGLRNVKIVVCRESEIDGINLVLFCRFSLTD